MLGYVLTKTRGSISFPSRRKIPSASPFEDGGDASSGPARDTHPRSARQQARLAVSKRNFRASLLRQALEEADPRYLELRLVILGVLDRAHSVTIVPQELYLISRAIRHGRQLAEARVLAVKEGVARLARRQVLGRHVLPVSAKERWIFGGGLLAVGAAISTGGGVSSKVETRRALYFRSFVGGAWL